MIRQKSKFRRGKSADYVNYADFFLGREGSPCAKAFSVRFGPDLGDGGLGQDAS
jgi:hypothetical protein